MEQDANEMFIVQPTSTEGIYTNLKTRPEVTLYFKQIPTVSTALICEGNLARLQGGCRRQVERGKSPCSNNAFLLPQQVRQDVAGETRDMHHT